MLVEFDDQNRPKCTHEFDGCTHDGTICKDPYQSDVYGKKVLVVLCVNCYEKLCEEI